MNAMSRFTNVCTGLVIILTAIIHVIVKMDMEANTAIKVGSLL